MFQEIVDNIIHPGLLTLVWCMNNKEWIEDDVDLYFKQRPHPDLNDKRFFVRVQYLLIHCKTFRNVLYYRMQKRNASRFTKLVTRIICPSIETIEISGEIDKGLFIGHNYCVLVPHYMGKNSIIMGGVTIGVNKGRNPTIGNNVYIGANAVVIGGILIGDDVKIGANAMVLCDIPEGRSAVGNPARII